MSSAWCVVWRLVRDMRTASGSVVCSDEAGGRCCASQWVQAQVCCSGVCSEERVQIRTSRAAIADGCSSALRSFSLPVVTLARGADMYSFAPIIHSLLILTVALSGQSASHQHEVIGPRYSQSIVKPALPAYFSFFLISPLF